VAGSLTAENSLDALKKVVKRGYSMVEIDLRLAFLGMEINRTCMVSNRFHLRSFVYCYY